MNDVIPIDRITPTLRPDAPVVMRPAWSHLLFLHWSVNPQQLQDRLPPGLELDFYDGKAYVGLIPFTMSQVRPPGVPPLRLFTDFHETNVRTYVHRDGRDPGVWFFSLDAASAPAVGVARLWFKLPYFFAQMSLEAKNNRIEYSTKRRFPCPLPAECNVSYSPCGEPVPAEPGTLEYFLIERYILYSHASNQLFSGRVHHAPYQLQTAQVHSLRENMIVAAGIDRGAEAPLIHYASEVRTEIFSLQPVS